MPTQWHELLELARAIATGMQGEAARRAAASRAYYAAFHCASEHLGIREYIGHAKIVERLLCMQSHNMQAAGRLLHQAMRRRVKADYQLGRPFTEEDMRACMRAAERVANMLGRKT